MNSQRSPFTAPVYDTHAHTLPRAGIVSSSHPKKQQSFLPSSIHNLPIVVHRLQSSNTENNNTTNDIHRHHHDDRKDKEIKDLNTFLGAPPPSNNASYTNDTGSSNSSTGSFDDTLSFDIADLRSEISTLRNLIVSQGQTISEQQETIDLLRGYMKTRATQSPVIENLAQRDDQARYALANADITDRRAIGLFDARYHSTATGATPRDYRILPQRIVLVRHAESEGNVDNRAYTYLPDPQVPLTPKGWRQALDAGETIKRLATASGETPKLFFYTSPYLRSKQTYEGVAQAFDTEQIAGVQEEVQLREQDFGNFQDAEGKKREKAERLRFGRFFYRFPNGESGADVYDRMTLFEDHLVRDINAGRFSRDSSLVLVTHGLALRIFLMRWFHWTVDQFMQVYNPPNAMPLILERVTTDAESRPGGPVTWIHTKALYSLSKESMAVLEGCTPDMCSTSWVPRGLGKSHSGYGSGRKAGGEGMEDDDECIAPPREVHELLESIESEKTGPRPC